MIAAEATNAENLEERKGDPPVEDRIRNQTRKRIASLENANLRDLTYRLAELDQEWNIEHILDFVFGGVVVGGVAMSVLSKRKWLLFPTLAGCFLLQQAIAGWCPPLSVLRRLGFRTAAEINRERMALEVLRGDFAHLAFLPGKAAWRRTRLCLTPLRND